MHLLLSITLILVCYFRKDWKKIHTYHLTVMYIIICDLLYNLLCHRKPLWRYTPDIFQHYPIIVDILHSFVNLPVLALFYLANYPFEGNNVIQSKYIIKWIICSFLVELVFLYFKRIELINGYEVWMEIPFYSTMFVMLRLHHKRPFLSYFLSVLIVIFLLFVFKIPLRA